jgi:NADH dehydrogenase FAD-containing subunit
MVEDDFLDRANVDLIQGEIKSIDTDKKEIVIKGLRAPLKFEKIIIAWGSEINKLNNSYTNVHYIEDKFSHAKIHN